MGRGHAIPDLAIVAELRKICPEIRIVFVSYGTGAEIFAAAGEETVHLGLPEMVSPFELLVSAGVELQKWHSRVVVSHEEAAVMSAAKIFGLPTVFLTHWFAAPQTPLMQALVHADEILFMEKAGIFPEPESVRGRVRYLGPVVRNFQFRPEHREQVRSELKMDPNESLILVLPGREWSGNASALCDLVVQAFELMDRPKKRLLWVTGKDRDTVLNQVSGHAGIQVVPVERQVERLMVASDLAITRGTYSTGNELQALGIPSISLSDGTNYIDDFFARARAKASFYWWAETDAAILAKRMETLLDQGLLTPDSGLLQGRGAKSVAEALAASLRARNSASHSLTRSSSRV